MHSNITKQSSNSSKSGISLESSPSLLPKESHKPTKVSIKSMETALGIERDVNLSENSAQKFFKTRQEFYEQRQRASYLLENDLFRWEFSLIFL